MKILYLMYTLWELSALLGSNFFNVAKFIEKGFLAEKKVVNLFLTVFQKKKHFFLKHLFSSKDLLQNLFSVTLNKKKTRVNSITFVNIFDAK